MSEQARTPTAGERYIEMVRADAAERERDRAELTRLRSLLGRAADYLEATGSTFRTQDMPASAQTACDLAAECRAAANLDQTP